MGHELADSLCYEMFGLTECDGERQSPLAYYSGRGSLKGFLPPRSLSAMWIITAAPSARLRFRPAAQARWTVDALLPIGILMVRP
jgi:hypothetical protein